MRTRRSPRPSSQHATMTCEAVLPDEFRNGADDSRPRSSSEVTDGLQRSRRVRRPNRQPLMRYGGRFGWAVFGEASHDVGSPISGQHLGFVGLVGAFVLPDLLGTALF